MRYLLLLEELNKLDYVEYKEEDIEDLFIDSIDNGATLDLVNTSIVSLDMNNLSSEYNMFAYNDNYLEEHRKRLRNRFSDSNFSKCIKYEISISLRVNTPKFNSNDIKMFSLILNDLKSIRNRFDLVTWNFGKHNPTEPIFEVDIDLYKKIPNNKFKKDYLKKDYDDLKNRFPDPKENIYSLVKRCLHGEKDSLSSVILSDSGGYLIFILLGDFRRAFMPSIISRIKYELLQGRYYDTINLGRFVKCRGDFDYENIKSLPIDFDNLMEDGVKKSWPKNPRLYEKFTFIVMKIDNKKLDRIKKEYIKSEF